MARTGRTLGIGGGFIVYLIIFGVTVDVTGMLWCIAVGFTYALVMAGAQDFAVGLLERRRTLRTRRDVLVRVVVLGIVTVVSFIAASALIELVAAIEIFGNTFILVISATFALGASLIGNGYFHLELFHTRLLRAEEAALRSELQALRAQINPHFLFNSLNSIAALVRIDPAAAERVTESLADLFRYSLRSSVEQSVSLAEEIESVELYLDIERARFPERLAWRIDVEGDVLSARVPSLLLQPLVENGVKHGVARTGDRVTVSIDGVRDGDGVRIVVADDGPGFATTDIETLVGRGHGLANIRERLRLEYGDAATVEVKRNSITLRFPFRAIETRLSGGMDAALPGRR